jgi:membrane fusion protein, multidrug efflux system
VVTNGQPLFEIDPSDYAARVRQVEGIVAADRANLALSRGTLERNESLQEKKLISQENFDTLKTRVEATEAQLKMDEAALELARLNLARCTITAAMAGVCSRRLVDDGNLVGAGQTRLMNLRSYDPIYVDFAVPEQHLTVLRKAMAAGPVPVRVQPQDETNSIAGTLECLDNAVNTLTGTLLLRAQVPNADLKLWAGQFVDIEITAGIITNAVMVPEGAVQMGKMGTYLYAVNSKSEAELRPVKTGVRHADRIQIVEGVAAGEKIVVLGQLMLAPGAQVMEPPPPPPAGATNAPAQAESHGKK